MKVSPFKRGMKFEMAPQTRVAKLENEVREVLGFLGHPEALVTDQSTVYDFISDETELADLTERFGFEVHGGDYIWELAERI